MPILLWILAVVALLLPILARAEGKNPLNYDPKQYVFVLAISLLGGLVSWLNKVRKGDAQAWNVMQLIGELCTSAFAGLMAFWLCEWSGAHPLLTASMTGIAGHMGTRAITTFETFIQKRWGAVVTTPEEPPHA